MDLQAPPLIFSPTRRLSMRRRMLALQKATNAPRYIMQDMIEDVLERLAFLRFEPASVLIVGDWTGTLAKALKVQGASVSEAEPAASLHEEQPYPQSGFDLIVSLGTLDTVNDLPGALIHIRNALNPGGMMIASFMGAGCLPMLREAMLAADRDRPAPRLHPSVDVRSGGQLLQRTGFSDAVIDSRSLDVSFRSLGGLIADLRAQGLSNVLANGGPPLRKSALKIACEVFTASGQNGRTVEHFELLTLSGWRR